MGFFSSLFGRSDDLPEEQEDVPVMHFGHSFLSFPIVPRSTVRQASFGALTFIILISS